MSLYSRIRNVATSLLLGGLLLGFQSPTFAQGLGNSPYTLLGIGELYSEGFGSSQSMGEAGVASSNGIHVNNLNPALWANNRITTLEFGAIGQYKNIEAPSKSQRDFGANLSYFVLAFPVAPKWTSGISLKPYSFIDYESRNTGKVPGSIYDAYYTYKGKGAVNKAAFTNAFQIGKYVTVGLEASYLFGNVKKSSESLINIGDGKDYTATRNERTSYSDIALRGGAAVRIPIAKDKITKLNKLFLNLGGTYSFGNDINAQQTSSIDLSQNTFVIGVPDTLTHNEKGNVHLPSQYRLGASLEWPYKLTLAVDFEHQAWNNYKSFSNSSDGLSDVNKVHVGMEYIPNIRSTTGYFNQVAYRIGFSHGNMPYTPVGQKELKDSNVSLGFSFPIGRSANTVTLTLIGGSRGVVSDQSFKETYGRVIFGLSLSDRDWFRKQKID